MNKVAKKFVKPTVKKLNPLLPILIVAAITGLLLLGLVHLFGVFRFIPRLVIPGWFVKDGFWLIEKEILVFVVGMIAGIIIGIWYFVYRPNKDTIVAYWQPIPTWVQATIVGAGSSIAVAIGLTVAVYYYGFSDYLVPVGFFVTWPTITGATILRYRRAEGCPSRKQSLRIGYTRATQLETRTVSVVIGFLVAGLTGVLTWYLTLRFAEQMILSLAIAVALFVWALVTVIMYNWYESKGERRTDLAIVEVRSSDGQQAVTVRIQNESDQTVDLSYAQIQDTEFNPYRFNLDIVLGPGELCRFELPEPFCLAPNDSSRKLPLGYTLKQGSPTPSILTRYGDRYDLQRKEPFNSEDKVAMGPGEDA